MAFSRDSLAVLQNRTYDTYKSLFRPLDNTPRHSLLKVFAQADAGMYHQLLGDLDFFSRQLFPDTAQGDYLRLHWSSRVPPLYAQAARGTVDVSGTPNIAIPTGTVFASMSGERYYTEGSYRIGDSGTVTVTVKAEKSGSNANLGGGEKVAIVSALPAGIDSEALTSGSGIGGGADSETDAAYLTRVLTYLRNPSRYGAKGDFAAWALDSSIEVSGAWEFKNFGIFGALLLVVIGGNQLEGVQPVSNLQAVTDYINSVAPPITFTVRSPSLVPMNPTVALGDDDTDSNRGIVSERMKIYLQSVGKPLTQITAGEMRWAIIDGVVIKNPQVKINGSTTGIMETTMLEYPILGVTTWE
jgi:hypothetical protein